MKMKWTSMLTASVLILTAGVLYYRNASRHSASLNKSDLRDAANSPNIQAKKRNPAHANLTVQAASETDAQPQQLSQKIDTLADSGLENIAKMFAQSHAFVIREAYPKGEVITKTNIRDNSPSFNTVGTVKVSGPMSTHAFSTAAMNRVAADQKSGNMSQNDATAMQSALYECSGLTSDNYQFYTVHWVNDEDGDSLDAVIVDKSNNQTLGFTIDGGE